ncbi:alpha/beta fold hydrolase [Desulfosediminicola flagellatus]|uniref:alpha/beta fold hydrolase n=1 Tax=Desulfosediminicola flagellatus TaxID=2569541 RepID=UPI0010AD4F83|nr:alpha/beta fold hydrolase [Desulfosediminicola flagellatus]
MAKVTGILHFRLKILMILMVMSLFSGCMKYPVVPTDQAPLSDKLWQAEINGPNEFRTALSQASLGFISHEDYPDIPVRVFGAEGEKEPVIFTHGLQSHSGWFVQSAAFLADLGHPVYVMDRMGSGLSRAQRGDVKDFHQWAREIEVVASFARERHRSDRFYLVGHCFGAIPATVYAYMFPDNLKGLILSTPAIYTRTSIPFGDMIRIFLSRSGARNFLVPVTLEPESFTELPEYQEFVRSDQLSLKAATGDFYYQVYKARKYITGNPDLLQAPLLMVIAGEDPICDNERNRRFFDKVSALDKHLDEFTDARHILEFSPEKDAFFATVSNWLKSR